MIELRASQVTIDTPRLGAMPFVAVWVQRLIHDEAGNVIQTINREKMINRSLGSIAVDIYQYSDPVTQNSGYISGAGLGSAITVAVRHWILEEYPEASYIGGKVVLE